MVKSAQTIIRNGSEAIFADLNTPSGIITIGSEYKRSVDISTENFPIPLKEIISFLDPNIKTYVIGDFKIFFLEYSTSATGRKFSQFNDISQLVSCNYPSNSRDTTQLHFNW